MGPFLMPFRSPKVVRIEEKIVDVELPKVFDYFCPACLFQTNEFTVICPKCGHEGLRESGKDRFRKV